MYNNIKKLIENKKVLILGFGREGHSTLNLIKKIGGFSKIAIADMNDFICDDNIAKHIGNDYLNNIKNYDIIFKSPGVIMKNFTDIGNAFITTQIEQFLKVYGNKTIGITGTKGKSTVSTLLYEELSKNKIENSNFLFAGNIGVPVFDIIDNINNDTVVVLELSCHQLENCRYSPHIAVLLNLYEEHLDHYKSFYDYKIAKTNVFFTQSRDYTNYMLYTTNSVINDTDLNISICDKNDISKDNYKNKINDSIYNINSSNTKKIFIDKNHMQIITKNILPFNSFEDVGKVKLIGEHNLLNVAFVYAIAKKFDISDKDFIKVLREFNPLHHRLEFLGIKNNIYYYDDSIATAPEATICAIESIKNIDTLLLGGMDRGIHYDKLIEYLLISKVKNIICMYESGNRIYNSFIEEYNFNTENNINKCDINYDFDNTFKSDNNVDYKHIIIKNKNDIQINVYYVDNLEIATNLSKMITKKDGAVVLSPASASYGYFKNFEERGDKFNEYINF